MLQRAIPHSKQPAPNIPPSLLRLEGNQKTISLHLSGKERGLIQRIKARIKRKEHILENQKGSLLEVYDKFFEKTGELEQQLKSKKNGKSDDLKKQLFSVRKTKNRLATLIRRISPSWLSREEEALIRGLEKANAVAPNHFSRKTEISVFRIYTRLSRNEKRLEEVCGEQKDGQLREEAEKERALVKEAMSRIANLIVIANRGLVCSIAWKVMKKRGPRSLSLDDLIDEGNIAQYTAIERFDYKRGNKYSTYATWWIKQAMKRAIDDQDRVIRLPVHLVEALHKIKRSINTYRRRHQTDPTIQEIAKATGLSEERIIKTLDAEPVQCDLTKGTIRYFDVAVSMRQNGKTVFEAFASEQLKQNVHELLDHLDPRSREILERRFGLNGKEHVETLEEIGTDLNLTRERIRQLQLQALRKLKETALEIGLADL